MTLYSDLLIAQSVTNYWPLDETSGATAVAAVGGVNLAYSGTVTQNALGAVNTAYRFTGSTASALIGASNASMAFDSTIGLSFSLIIKPNATMSGSGAWGILSRRSNSSANRTFSLFMQGSTGGTINVDVGNTQIRWDTGFVPLINEYYHVAFVWRPSGGEFRFYVNGELYTNSTGRAPESQLANSPFYIAALGAATPSQLFPGVIDEVAVWNNKSLTDAEIRAQYHAAFPITKVFNGTDWKYAERRVL